MYISKETIEHFADKGIVVKYYPDATYDGFLKRLYDNEVKSYFDYYKDHVAGCDAAVNGRANVIFQSNEDLLAEAKKKAQYNIYDGGYCRMKSSYEHTTLYIEYDEGNNHRVICQKVNVKSKEITVEYVDKLLAKDRKAYNGTFGKFADAMNKLVRETGLANNCFIYPTTYGIGVWVFYNWYASENIAQVEKILKRNNVEYYNEYSDAGWVYRFKISKKQANIQLALTA